LASGTPFWNIFFANVHQAPRSAAEWWRIERARIGGKSGDHPRTQRVGNIEHDIVGSPVFDEGFQLIFQILRLLVLEVMGGAPTQVSDALAAPPLCQQRLRWL
jgi:hypothetical protein